MSGILANSVSKTMVSGDTAADQVTSGFVALEEITLTTTGTPTSYVWGLSKPSGSTARTALSSTTAASPTFTPDVEGYFVVTCLLDGTTLYILRIAVADDASVTTVSTLKFLPIADSLVPVPATGRTVYYSSTQSALVEKRPDNTVHVITVVA